MERNPKIKPEELEEMMGKKMKREGDKIYKMDIEDPEYEKYLKIFVNIIFWNFQYKFC